MENKINLKFQLEQFNNFNKIVDSEGKETDSFNFYDWFCKDSSLKNKAVILFKKLNKISKSKKIDLENTYCFFKNNCPVVGGLYDDFRICDLKSGNVIYTITPSSKIRGISQSEIWGKENDFKGPLLVGSWKQVLEFFLN